MSRIPVSVERLSRSRFPSVHTDQEAERPTTSSQRLFVAIIRRAIWDFVLYREVDEEEEPERFAYAVDAAGWLFFDGTEEVDGAGRYTFRHLCDVLDLDPKRVRRHALDLTREDIQALNNTVKE